MIASSVQSVTMERTQIKESATMEPARGACQVSAPLNTMMMNKVFKNFFFISTS